MDNKLEFAQRLRDAMQAAGLEPRPGVLLTLFNTRYWGRSVTFQAVSRWLKGESIPAQDKLVVLASLLKIEPEVLRFGEDVRRSAQEHRQRWDVGVGYLEREAFDAFLQLPPPQRKVVREVILTFAKVHGKAEAIAAEPASVYKVAANTSVRKKEQP
ncbi:transcriptional regulator with XRE-family HTH domain [Comamonas odontotermitis]|uniref:Transcriptional regulator with XRE-family HTH domain n=1 Tax=Comamonas odontotermitis TaxID=379895 RepID=A0ABR6RGZ5_9BURK|nr:transcriptional regulator [Comamonas odontotermitis]MBB6578419.1 transcriptional regulator with XRE-family HTH domain [Comamonas odontotermitis]